jgi:hypothetical protein
MPTTGICQAYVIPLGCIVEMSALIMQKARPDTFLLRTPIGSLKPYTT